MIAPVTTRGALALLWWQARAELGDLVAAAGECLMSVGRRIGGRGR